MFNCEYIGMWFGVSCLFPGWYSQSIILIGRNLTKGQVANSRLPMNSLSLFKSSMSILKNILKLFTFPWILLRIYFKGMILVFIASFAITLPHCSTALLFFVALKKADRQTEENGLEFYHPKIITINILVRSLPGCLREVFCLFVFALLGFFWVISTKTNWK